MYSDFSKGSYDKTTEKCGEFGALATWITANHLENFAEQDKWTRQAVEMIQSEDASVVEYIDTYFWNKICHINKNNISWSLKYYFKKGLNNNNQQVIDKLKAEIVWEENHPWWNVFAEELKSHPDIKYEEFPF